PRPVESLAVAVVLAVRLVVLLVVRNEVVQRETVVAGDEVDAGRRPPSGAFVQVGAAREPVCELAECRVLTAPVIAHRVAVATVPLGPLGREVPDLVPAFADVPGLGDELHLAD